MNRNKGITLVALVVTIIVLIILAGVSINLILGENGIITMAKKAKENMEIASQEEQIALDNLYMEMDNTPTYNKYKKVNAPTLLTGMMPIKFEMPTDTEMGTAVTTTTSDTNWYEYGTTYETKKWANAQTKDGSMWVWIPRFAYKITGQTIDVKFLIGTTDNYYKEDGTIGTAQRQKTPEQIIDSTAGYTVHPAFTNESSINYANGGWDSELTGIWVAKFEAGYASGNNTAPVVAANGVNYSQMTSYVHETESTTEDYATLVARNWLDGIYAVKNADGSYSWKDGKETAIKYPTFQGTTYAMNYINHNDAYRISRALTNSGNIYGLSSASTNSHLMKNSEWGACAYLSQSKYGQNGTEMTTNNINLNSGGDKRTEEIAGQIGVVSVYAVTGCSSNTTDTANNVVTIENLNASTGDTGVSGTNGTAYKWNQKTGQNASTTGTIYGIYDMSGGTWERTADFISNGNGNLLTYGQALLDETKVTYNESTKAVTPNTGASTKYATIYPYLSPETGTAEKINQANFKNNTKIYGDAVRETTSSNAGTSNTGWNTSAWNSDYSFFPASGDPFFARGGSLWDGSDAGSFAFRHISGPSSYNIGFRTVLVVK